MMVGPLSGICDANHNSLQYMGTVKLPIRLGRFLIPVDFIVCHKPATPVILGTDYSDRFVEAIRPRTKAVELANCLTVPIARRPPKRALSAKPLPPELEPTLKDGRASPKVIVAKRMTIPAQSQTFVPVTTDRRGLIVVEPDSIFYENLGLTAANSRVQVKAGVPFKLLISNFNWYLVNPSRLQVVAQAFPHPTIAVPSRLTIGEVLGITEESTSVESWAKPTDISSSVTELRPEALKSSPSRGEKDQKGSETPNVDDLYWSRMRMAMAQKFKTMLSKYSTMWDGSLGKIETFEPYNEFVPGTRPIAQPPYRARPKAREIESSQVKKMLDAGVIEPAQSAWTALVVLILKPDGTVRYCADYRKLNVVTVKDT